MARNGRSSSPRRCLSATCPRGGGAPTLARRFPGTGSGPRVWIGSAPTSTHGRGPMRFVAVGQEQRYLCAPRPATVESAVGMCTGPTDVTIVWERIELPYGRVALRTPYGRFL